MWICGYVDTAQSVCASFIHVSYEQNYDIHVDYCMYNVQVQEI